MFRPKELPKITKDVVLNENIFVVAKVLHLKNDGRPNFQIQDKIDADCFDDFFEEETQNEE